MQHSATYSPEDNKLRLYPVSRLDAATYARVKAAGFAWAPKQELFVAGMWTPAREDLLMELCGEIEDEDTSLVERAEQRADRFDDYSDKRNAEALRARDAVDQLTSHMPMGQPIIVGHHSERRARKDAQRIENGMRQAVRLWETAEYWQQRAAGALRLAKYKERPDVRARRIRKIEADQRKLAREKADAEKFIKAWSADGFTKERALFIANNSHLSRCFPLADYPRAEPASQYEGPMSLWSALEGGVITAEQARDMALRAHRASLAWAERWLSHYGNRLAYERAMLDEQGGTLADRTRPEIGGAVRCMWAPRGGWAWIKKVNKVTVSIQFTHNAGGHVFKTNVPFDKLHAIMAAADVAQARNEGRLIDTDDGCGFFLAASPASTDTTPEATTATPAAETAVPKDDDAASIDALRAQLRQGVQVEVAPLLYPTPAPLAETMADLAAIEAGMTVLDPSAGTGVLLDAARKRRGITTAVELHWRLADRLRQSFDDVRQGDFLAFGPELGQFDRVLMNPPFDGGADIAHILRARSLLKPGGVLVAICADGPRQNAQLRPLAEGSGGHWEALPAGSFRHAGTDVRTALLVILAS